MEISCLCLNFFQPIGRFEKHKPQKCDYKLFAPKLHSKLSAIEEIRNLEIHAQ